MLFRLLLLFTLVPLAELAILVRLGAWLGLFPTLLLVLGTGAAGAWLARREGLRSWRVVQAELASGRLPGEEVVHGLLILAAGLLLITPGALTDLAGLLLLVRPVRRVLLRRVRSRLEAALVGEAAGWRPVAGGRIFWWSTGRREPSGVPDPGSSLDPPRGKPADAPGARPAKEEENVRRAPRVIEL